MNIKNVTHGGGVEQEKWGNLPNFLLEVEILVFTNIQAISELVSLQLDDNWFLMCNYAIFNLQYYRISRGLFGTTSPYHLTIVGGK